MSVWENSELDFLLDQAAEAAALEGAPSLWVGGRDAPEPDDTWGDCWKGANCKHRHAGSSVNVDLHVCPGPVHCKHITLNNDRIWVCELSGVCWGGEHVEEAFDNQMNRRSSNPDEISGCASFVGYRSKRDAAALSEAATLAAAGFEDAETVQYEAPASPQREAPKRGARCVGEVEQPRVKRRSRTCKRDVENASGTRALVEDAVNCINKLLHCDGRRDIVLADSPHAKLAAADVSELRTQLHRRYLRECLSTGARPNMHVVADISIGAEEAVRTARLRVQYENSRSAAQIGIEFREKMANLAVALWLASCKTPYMKSLTKSDGFRAFVSGVVYGTRRGFTLSGGQVLVPCLPELADVLPNLRMASQSKVKTLQAASHRGLCTLVRSLNSMQCDEARLAAFQNAATIARQVLQTRRRSSTD